MKRTGNNTPDYEVGQGITIDTDYPFDTESESTLSSAPNSLSSAPSSLTPNPKGFFRSIRDLYKTIVGEQTLSYNALTPSKLNLSLCNELKKSSFNNLKPKTDKYEPQQYLMHKEGINKVMFVSQSCCDANKDSYEFASGGRRSLADAINDVRNSNEYKKAKKENKEIEIYTPLALTKRAYGIKRAHWVTAIIEEKADDSIQFNILDSMGTSLGYNFDHINNEVIGSWMSTEAEGTNEKNDSVVVSSPSIKSGVKHKSDQGLHDHTSCGHYVIKYITEHAQYCYPKAQTRSASHIASPEKTPNIPQAIRGKTH